MSLHSRILRMLNDEVLLLKNDIKNLQSDISIISEAIERICHFLTDINNELKEIHENDHKSR